MRSIECGIADDLECPLNTPNHPIFTFCITIHSYFYIVDLENFATASRRYTGDIHNSPVVGLFMTHCLQLNLQFHTIGLVRTCRISSFCTVVW